MRFALISLLSIFSLVQSQVFTRDNNCYKIDNGVEVLEDCPVVEGTCYKWDDNGHRVIDDSCSSATATSSSSSSASSTPTSASSTSGEILPTVSLWGILGGIVFFF